MANRQTAVVCDTTCYLPADLIARHGIRQVSLYVTLGDETQPESEITDYGAFYERLRDTSLEFKTSQPSVGDFTEVYRPLLDDGLSIVSIHLSAGISGTYESARQARQALINEGKGGERIEVIDSRSACGGMGLMILAAARAADAGADPAAVAAKANAVREALTMWFAVGTLEYLRRGGRVGGAQAWLGTALQIKPILTLAEEITPVERVRTSRRAFERMVDFGRELKEAGQTAWVVQHIHDPETAERLIERGREIFGSDPVFVGEIGPVIGAHAGPGLLGIGGTKPEALG
jgi:DegV family protein with EDD domain